LRAVRYRALSRGWAFHPVEGDIAAPGDPLLTEQVAMEAFIAGFHTDLRFNHSSGSWLGVES
jgi:hypothetical protein